MTGFDDGGSMTGFDDGGPSTDGAMDPSRRRR